MQPKRRTGEALPSLVAGPRLWQSLATSSTEPIMKFMILVRSNPDLEARILATSDAAMQARMAEIRPIREA